MKLNKQLFLTCTAALCLTPVASHADGHLSQAQAAKYYLEYEEREPCQNYRELPQSLVGIAGCGSSARQKVTADTGEFRLLPVVSTYTIFFDFDKSAIRADQQWVLNRLVNEIKIHQPAQVTVVGHADTSGNAKYNQKLSAKRADAVSKALTALNIPNIYLDEHAAGETDLAIPTPDDTKLAENRRVVIQFRK